MALVSEFITKGQAGVVRRLVERGILAPDATGEDGRAIVHLAAQHGAVGLLEFLILTQGVNPSTKNLAGDTPLHMAIRNRRKAAATFLIDQAPGCDVGAAGMQGTTPLMAAAGRGMVGMARALVEKGADVDAVDEKGRTALGYAIKSPREECALWLLEEAGASWRATYPLQSGKRGGMLELAAMYNCPRVVKSLARRMRAAGDEAAAEEGEEEAAMVRAAGRAAFRGSLAALKALVEEGLDLKAAGALTKITLHDGKKAMVLPSDGLLSKAVRGGHQQVVKFLLEEGRDPYYGDDGKDMPLHVAAAAHGRTSLLEWLMARFPIPLDGDEEDWKGHFALYLAAYGGHMKTVRWLIGAGANPRRQTVGLLPSEIAEQQGHHDVAVYLREEEAAAEGRVRNEKRRAKQKKAKARQRAAAAAASASAAAETVRAAGDGGGGEEQEEGDEGEGGAATGAVAAAGGGGGHGRAGQF